MLKGYRTIIFNAIMTPVMLLRLWGIDSGISEEMISEGITALDTSLALFWGIGNLFFRTISDTKVGKKD